MKQDLERIKGSFPSMSEENIKITSPVSNKYNCIAWVYGRNDINYWPDDFDMSDDYKWPDGIKRGNNIDSFINLYKSIGYEICKDGKLEQDYEKICIYEKDNLPKHAAKQIPNGNWSSKLGEYFDVEHTESALSGGRYGDISIYMKRRLL